MHENASVQHTRHKWIGKVGRAPDGDRAGAFYRNDTCCFYVTWTIPRRPGPDQLAVLAEVGWQPGEQPADGWYPAADLVRVV